MKDEQKEEIKKYLKIGIIILLVVALYVFMIFKINGKTPISNLEEKYLIVGDYLIMEYKDKKWKQLNEFSEEILDSKFSVYDGLTKIDELSMQYASGKWIFLKNDYEEENVSSFRYAFTGIENIAPANYNWSFYETSDANILLEFLKMHEIKDIDAFIDGTTKVSYDFDSDGIKETIYTTTNESLSANDETTFSGIFMEKNGTIITINEKEGPYYIQEVLDIDNDGKYEIIISNGVVNIPTIEDCYQIYKINNDKWEIIKDCEF